MPKTKSETKSISAKIDPAVYRETKVAAVRLDRRMADIVAEALELWLRTTQKEGSQAGA